MKRLNLKLIGVLVFLAAGAIILLRAQNRWYSPQQKAGGPISVEQVVTVEDIGEPTDDDPWQEMDKLITAYYNPSGLSFKGTMKLFDDNGPQEKLVEELPFQYMVRNEDYYYSLDKIEVVKKKSLLLIADHLNKIISVSSDPSTPETNTRMFDISVFRKMMEDRKADAKVTQTTFEKILTIENIKDPQVQGYRIYYNPQTYRINKMLIGMVRLNPIDETDNGQSSKLIKEMKKDERSNANENGTDGISIYTYYLEIIYSETDVMTSTEANFNPENKFLHFENNKTNLNKQYADYQFIASEAEAEPGETNREKK